jgi:hypothetical protein
MASLSTILQNKSRDITFQETNIERGEIYYFNPGTVASSIGPTMCWIAPSNGVVIVEIWGASGSGGRMCCCGSGIPGNPGAYAKKQISVLTGNTITGTMGRSCGNATLCCRGRSENTCICYVTSTVNGAVCAQGGIGGTAYCGGNGNAHYCCFIANSFCGNQTGFSAGCGTICNYRTSADIAVATGGDINCSGGFSCTSFYHCNSCCNCSQYQHVKTSPGVFSNNGGVITFTYDASSEYANPAGSNYHPFISALNAMSRQPSMGQPASWCWSGSRACSCYESHGCMPYLPHGVPGVSAMPCDSVRDDGLRGGHGAVRIKFIGS